MKNEIKIINTIIKMLNDGVSVTLCVHDLEMAAKLIDALPCYQTDTIIDTLFGGEAEVTEDA